VREQLSFAGLEGGSGPTDGVFFATFPELNVATRAAQAARHLCTEHGLMGRPIAAERLHVSLRSVGDYVGLPRGIIAAACEAAASVSMPAFKVAFDRAVSFRGRLGSQPLVLRGGDGVAGLMVLHQRLGMALRQVGLRCRANPQYEPHLTLLYGTPCVVEQPIETVGWTVREFVLVHSLHGQTRYTQLGQWSLQG
jgi:RNA 2',3'-cyclic 3'-phosphodiesterase